MWKSQKIPLLLSKPFLECFIIHTPPTIKISSPRKPMKRTTQQLVCMSLYVLHPDISVQKGQAIRHLFLLIDWLAEACDCLSLSFLWCDLTHLVAGGHLLHYLLLDKYSIVSCIEIYFYVIGTKLRLMNTDFQINWFNEIKQRWNRLNIQLVICT